MFTVLSNTRTSNLYLIAALAIAVVMLLSLVAVPAISAPQTSLVPVSGLSEAGSDYYQRHPDLGMASSSLADSSADFYLRHRDWTLAPVMINAGASDYFQRHPELVVPASNMVDTSDYFTRHPELNTLAESTDLSDYFQRH